MRIFLSPMVADRLIKAGTVNRFEAADGESFSGVIVARDRRAVEIRIGEHVGKFHRNDLQVIVDGATSAIRTTKAQALFERA